MKIKPRFVLRLLTTAGGCLFFTSTLSRAQTAPPAAAPAADPPIERKLYCVGYTHLDTQWRWTYPQVISEFLHNTLADNFRMFDKYPDYVFNFTGSNRYMMFREYYPNDYQTLKKCIADGKWYPAGSSVEEGDVNMPDGEAIIRQVLYGNEYFRREFGKQSSEYMLPDCFGFQISLPSLLAHCGLKGFSTQKLTWGSAVGIPFNVGVWEGPDGKGIVAALNPGSYNGDIKEDLSQSKEWKDRIDKEGAASGVYVDYHYYGVGDRGGSPHENSIKWLEKSVHGGGPVHVISATADQMFNELTPEQVAKLPRYKGDLLLTGHSTGELTSEAFMKRCERKIEQLADGAERASVAADWLGGASYPMQKLNAAWTLALGAQFHDTMAGTALPKSYEYSWNNEILALNQFAAVAQDGAGAVIGAMDTRGQGVQVVVYNPLTIDREDVAEATITVPDSFGKSISVVGPDGKAVPAQIVSRDGDQLHLLFLAKAPSVGFAVYDVRPAAAESANELAVTENLLENSRFKVTLNEGGDIASVYDKVNQREVLTAPARLEFLHENPAEWPAWNMDYGDRMHAPLGFVDGPCKMRIVESGPVRVAIEVERHARGSKFVQKISLSAGSAGDRVEVSSKIDWQTPECSLEALFPMAVSNPLATYESQSCAVQRGNNVPKKFEVPQQQWLDLTDSSGKFGTSILNDCKYGSDKPDDSTIRLTLLYTPGTRAGYQDQGSQDFGKHDMVYAIAPHADGWQQAGTPFMAQRLNQPLTTFQTPQHDGSLGRSFSLCKITGDHVTATAIKKAEDSDEIIIRLHEVGGASSDGVQVNFAGAIQSAREVDGQEREIGPAKVVDGHLVVDMTPFSLRAFAVKIAAPAQHLAGPVCQSVPLAYDLDAVSTHDNLSDGAFDSEGHTFAAEGFPAKIVSEGITFDLGSTADGQKNALVCKGQSISLPAGFNRVYFLAASVNGDVPATFQIDGQAKNVTVEDWSGYVGQWDNRLWQGVVPGLTYNWKNKLAGLTPGFVKPATVAWFLSHRHDPQKGNEYYKFSYLFKYGLDVPAGAKALKLPDNDRVRIFALTAANNSNDQVQPARPLYDTLADHGNNKDMASILPGGGKFNDMVTVSLGHSLYWEAHGLRYTLDGTEPTLASPVYAGPFLLSQKTTVKVKELDDSGAGGPAVSADFDINDTTPPTVLSATGSSILPSIAIRFSEPLRKDQAENIANYRLIPPLEIRSAELSTDGLGVTLTAATPPNASDSYQLMISGVSDVSPNANPVPSAPVALAVARPVFTLDSLPAGQSLEKAVTGLPVKASDAWTINLFVKPNHQPDDRTIIAGFGWNEDSGNVGTGRYLSKFSNGIHFWSRDQDGDSTTQLDVGRWQMLTVTYNGTSLQLFKNGKMISEQTVSLSDDQPTVRIAPLDPWEHLRRFDGQIKDFTIWNTALPAVSLRHFLEAMPAK